MYLCICGVSERKLEVQDTFENHVLFLCILPEFSLRVKPWFLRGYCLAQARRHYGDSLSRHRRQSIGPLPADGRRRAVDRLVRKE
jgi:hypothetical protein